jgi:hypothetical protein
MERRRVPLLLAAVLSSCMSWQLPASAQSAASLNAVSTSGKQRMLSQRVFKAYAQQALAVLPERAGPVLSASLEELRSANIALQTQAKSGMEAELKSQALLIGKLAALVAAPPDAKTLKQAAALSEELLANAESVTQGFIKAGGEAPGAMVNLAARQRMLSQRAAAAYFAYQTEIKSPELKVRALAAAGQFKAALSVFEDAKAEFPLIADRLELARMQMIFFDNALSNIDTPRKEQFITIATTSERVLVEMDLITGEIVKQLAARGGAGGSVATKTR